MPPSGTGLAASHHALCGAAVLARPAPGGGSSVGGCAHDGRWHGTHGRRCVGSVLGAHDHEVRALNKEVSCRALPHRAVPSPQCRITKVISLAV